MREEIIAVSQKFAAMIKDLTLTERENYELTVTIYQTLRRQTTYGGTDAQVKETEAKETEVSK